jgi:hypothetical protein
LNAGSVDATSAFREFVAQSLNNLHMPQAIGTLENMGLKLILGGGIKLLIEIFSCEFVPK